MRAALDARVRGGATDDPTAPSKGPGDKDPNEPAFTVRVVVTDTAGNRAEDRKMLFAYRDTTLHQGYAKDLGTGGEASPRLFDLNGDNTLDTVLADSSGELRVLNHDGQPLPSFNNGQPVRTGLYPNVHLGADSYNTVDPPREVLRTPAIGDIDGDLEPEIVDSAGEHVYAWEADGSAVAGFPVRIDPALSRPQDRTRNNHIKRGFTASPDARRPRRRRPPRHRGARARPARVRVGRRRQPAAGLPEEAAEPGHPGRGDHHDRGARRHHAATASSTS